MSALEALGQELREARQRRDLTLPEVERRIHIRVKFLDALEKGEAAALPSPAQTRGFLRNYARFLGLDGDAFVARWEEALHGKGRRRGGRASVVPAAPPVYRVSNVAQVAQAAPRRGRRIGLIALGMFGALGLVALVVLAIIDAQAPGESGGIILSPAPTLEASPLAANAQTATPDPAIVPKPSPLPNPNAPSGTPANPTGEVVVQIEIVARTWLRIIVDGQVAYLGAPGPNTLLQYRGREVNIRAANAAGLRIVVNDRDLGIVGARGQIFDQTFTQTFAAGSP